MLLEVFFPYEPVCPSVGWSVCHFVCYNSLYWREVSFPPVFVSRFVKKKNLTTIIRNLNQCVEKDPSDAVGKNKVCKDNFRHFFKKSFWFIVFELKLKNINLVIHCSLRKVWMLQTKSKN